MEIVISYFTIYLIPILMIIIGVFIKLKAPKQINFFYGYRTQRSMSSQEAWDYAQQLLGKYSLRIGISLIPIGNLFLLILPFSLDVITLINLGVGVICLLIPILFIEKELKKKF
ncbi:SdpI/YhfL protein family protein [Bacillus sp. cl95]|nr:SdpI/YhfL protein family protein [Bacillus sp. UNCCL13]SFQ83949.1 SdpI/YhfL protein family protein [Bacillus sp. cl95]